MASGSRTDVIYTDSGSLVFTVALLTVLENCSSMDMVNVSALVSAVWIAKTEICLPSSAET